MLQRTGDRPTVHVWHYVYPNGDVLVCWYAGERVRAYRFSPSESPNGQLTG